MSSQLDEQHDARYNAAARRATAIVDLFQNALIYTTVLRNIDVSDVFCFSLTLKSVASLRLKLTSKPLVAYAESRSK